MGGRIFNAGFGNFPVGSKFAIVKVMKKRIIFGLITAALVLILALGVNQFLVLRKAHSTFNNYYAFRGCEKLLEKTSDFGTCQTANGRTIKIVKFHDKWYLEGDLPWACLGNVCFGL
ncbi:MAG: hypothetical protein M1352_01580 [Patescibacteria group bacterium]|nr:hypothetical protein [Patescibacteria group bacterium]